jgi:CRISPR/Cas system-associated endoribonuclease Cas2
LSREPWYLISYDILDSRRLQRAHRLLRQQAHPLLESLFAFQGNPQALYALQTQLIAILTQQDDLLIYRLRTDQPIHRWGTACLPAGLYDFSLPPLIEHSPSSLARKNDQKSHN